MGEDLGVHAQLFDPGYATRDELRAYGRSLRRSTARRTHANWGPPDARPAPFDRLRAQDATRIAELVPIRWGRMLASPFAFFRGSAAVMAADLATTPVTGVHVQACGDAHLGNFGVYASPERRLVFDINDFDETLPGPWEWDLKRLTTSFVLEARDAGWSDSVARAGVDAAVDQYVTTMSELSEMTSIAISYERMDPERFIAAYGNRHTRSVLATLLEKTRRRTQQQAARKWVRVVDGAAKFIDDPPLIQRLSSELVEDFHRFVTGYRETLQHDRSHVLHQYRFRDAARKVVGVGSVGRRSYMLLLEGRGPGDLVILQAKEASSSVLSAHLGPSGHRHHGQRVVVGQRLMQATSDPFLGWARFGGRDFYVRQIRDHKGPTDRIGNAATFPIEARVLAGTLARAHARTVDPAVISGYLGRGRRFCRSLHRFSFAYADQVEADHEMTCRSAERTGLPVERGV